MKSKFATWSVIFAAIVVGSTIMTETAYAATASEINRDSIAALNDLYKKTPGAQALGKNPRAFSFFQGSLRLA